MRLLLDTHAILWLLDGDRRLGAAAVDAITDAANDAFVSAVSLWEIAIKIRIGKLKLDLDELIGALAPSGLQILDLRPAHLLELARLPIQRDHRDPFDHLLIAQAIAESLTFVSADGNVLRYPVSAMPC